ncbi:Pop3p SCDLUD_005136 [Saccharomycodes ludwigii]|uniref:Pop3p n=1 Tax=Saccharomycodes ludwigii TaxID=36035 RepID=UPI001E84D7D6|nr:hypothetical protein SCDLUD_005136 [Saccharomycodes ludwigii]KAH3898798.1 hypothetical protein SCDLUD_005136 [Saccharomycodes ludwigii]
MAITLKDANKTVPVKRQVYQPILENPYTSSSQDFPHVNEQQEIKTLLEITVLQPFSKNPNGALKIGFNQVYQYLENIIKNQTVLSSNTTDNEISDSDRGIYLFVCNKDGVSPVLYSQFPMMISLCSSKYMKIKKKETKNIPFKLIQLPEGSYKLFSKYINVEENKKRDTTVDNKFEEHHGLLLIPGKFIPNALQKKIVSNVGDVNISWLNDYINSVRGDNNNDYSSPFISCAKNLKMLSTSVPLNKNKVRKGKVLKKKKNMVSQQQSKKK